MSRRFLYTALLPSCCLFCVGYVVGCQFEPIWLRLLTAYPTGILAFFLFRKWGFFIIKK